MQEGEKLTTELMTLPKCPDHQIQLLLRKSHTPEQIYCGTWYSCPRCGYTVLFPSRELEN